MLVMLMVMFEMMMGGDVGDADDWWCLPVLPTIESIF